MLGLLHRLRGLVAPTLMVAALVISSLPQHAAAATGNPSYCDSEVDLLIQQEFATDVPVILVHGRDGKASDWGSLQDDHSFISRVDGQLNAVVVQSFGYNTNNWVTHKDSGPKLAKTIDCASRLSLQNGGKGKVVVIGYSMGGLVIREALSKRSSDNQRAIADEVGQAITIGTPHDGIIYPVPGRWGYNSAKLQALPKFPAQTIVHTIAGDVTYVRTDILGNETRTRPYNDTLVSTFSAHSGWTVDSDKGGGFKDIACEKHYNWYGSSPSTPCEHGQLIAWANNGVREDTIDAMDKYVSWLNTPVTPNSFTAGTITVKFDSRWLYGEYGASGPNEDIIGDDGNGALLITNMAGFCNDGRTMMQCMTQGGWTDNHVGTAPAITVGGRTPDSSLRFSQNGGANGNRIFWCFDTEKVCIDYGTGADVNVEPTEALLDLFHSATWSN